MEVFPKIAAFLCAILLGYLLKRKGFFGPTDYKILVKIVLNITMPCAVLVSFASYKPEFSLLAIVGLSFGMNCLMLLVALLCSRKYPQRTRAVWLNCVPSYNIGCFAMPFVQSFLPPAGLIGTCLYDLGNAMMCNGTTYAISKNILSGSKGLNIKSTVNTLLHSVPFISYFTMLVITLLNIPIPAVLVNFATPIGNANAFLAMFMVGMMLDLRIEKAIAKEVVGMLILRFLGATLASAAFYYLLPMSLEIRQALAITAFAPVSMTSTAFTPQAGGDPAVAACVNSFSILISIGCILTLLLLFGIL